jgi:hypothetical protein
MSYRFLACLVVAVALVVPPARVLAQTPPTSAKQATPASGPAKPKTWTAPRAPDGHPDLQGVWSNANLTPFERPKELAGKEFFTEEEAAEFARKAVAQANRDRRGATPEEDVAGAYNEAFFDRGTKVASTLRTSVVIEPADGRVPPLKPEARTAGAQRAAIQRRRPEKPQDFSLPVRCILWPTAGPPMIPGPYNNNYQIVQTRDYVAINVEMIHDVRVVPLDGRAHLPALVRLWMGDSVGHWEGDTLVVDTTNYTDKTPFRGSDQNLHVVERFTRINSDTIRYRFTIDDPTSFERPWTGEIAMSKTAGPIYEYACHEGNYSLSTMLAGARAEEKAEAGQAPGK